ncbi:MAG: YraN family protein [Candidatus Blackburnbacteria bacterium]|nr:YraN family protein [Candidatus Blackburnbacteria bacterium]
MTTRVVGNRGEDVACNFLKKQGYKIIARNFQNRTGEIDIVALDHNFLVFVEVKTRFSYKYGLPEESVTPQKINSIIRTGQYFKLLNPQTPDLMRVDVVAIDYVGNTTRLLKNVSQ